MKEIQLLFKRGRTKELQRFYNHHRKYFLRSIQKANLSLDESVSLYHQVLLQLRTNAIQGHLAIQKKRTKHILTNIAAHILLEKDLVLNKTKELPELMIHIDTQGKELTQEQKQLRLHLFELGKRCLELLLFFYARRLSYDEIVIVMGHESSTLVSSQKSMCLDKLKKKMQILNHGKAKIQEEADQIVMKGEIEIETTDNDLLGFTQNLQFILEKEDRTQFELLLQSFEVDLENTTPINSRYLYLKWAGCVLVLFLLLFWIFNPFKLNTSELYKEYFVPYKNVVTPILKEKKEKEDEVISFSLYERGNYKKAAKAFEDLYNQTGRPYLLLYQANALLADKNIDKAITVLHLHIKARDELMDRGKWYLALAYLKQKEVDKTKELLRELVLNSRFKTKDSERLLEALN